jgi:hypothetical protein
LAPRLHEQLAMFQPLSSKAQFALPWMSNLKSALGPAAKAAIQNAAQSATRTAESQATAVTRVAARAVNSYFTRALEDATSAVETPTAGSMPSGPAADNFLPRQDSVVARNSPPAPKTTVASSTSTTTKSSDVSTPPEPTPADRLNAALLALGYDPQKFKIESREEFVMFPGGGYIHRYTNVQLPNGMQENFSTDLMSRYPEITANEIKRMLNLPNGDPYSGLA